MIDMDFSGQLRERYSSEGEGGGEGEGAESPSSSSPIHAPLKGFQHRQLASAMRYMPFNQILRE